MDPILLALIIVLSVIFIVSLVARMIKDHSTRISTKFSFNKLEIDRSMMDYARVLLDENGLEDVQVVQCGFFSSMFVGNTYKLKTKTIRLSPWVAKKSNVTNLARVASLVALAKFHSEEKTKGLKAIELDRWLSWLPALFIPLVVVGLIVDFAAVGAGTYIYTLILSCVGLALTIISLVFSLTAIRTLNKSYQEGENMLVDMQIIAPEEEKYIKKIYSAWKKYNYVKAFESVFEAIYFGLSAILSLIKIGGKK